ncbi:SET domain-containing protein [Gymnopus androsaceus JB14]|uniref:SET domain-containing protein n=1 Tax=Gymnopus androsaceus JB14 TaxID=1447944 RepID=A0A6A4HSV7_9AGAR|nr:SET domain-containing protein [Gymnopus androsaceus JB14]
MDSESEQFRWRNLLEWLEGHGMDVSPSALLVERRQVQGTEYFGLFAKKTLSPKTVLFTVPKSALLNIRTLSPHYNAVELSASQLISLHLLIHRPLEGQESLDPLMGPYISTLPRDFDYHPLSWMVKKNESFVKLLPPSVIRALHDISSKFNGDLAAICSFVREHPATLRATAKPPGDFVPDNEELVLDYLWAWLNVNTRCIYYQVKNYTADPDNITLCPILDFANHTSNLPCMNPPSASNGSLRRDFSLLSPSDTCINANSELYLKYGAHCNRVLFVEYGFVLTADSIPKNQQVLEVNIDDIVEGLIEEKGEAGAWMKEVLESENYWGDWTMHSTSESAFPSYRLITALRLFALVLSTPSSFLSEETLRPWKDVILGRQEDLSEDQEIAWRNVLRRICVVIVERASRALDSIDKGHESIVTLWDEERYVAERILDLIENGEVF